MRRKYYNFVFFNLRGELFNEEIIRNKSWTNHLQIVIYKYYEFCRG